MKNERLQTHASAAFMILVWLFISAILGLYLIYRGEGRFGLFAAGYAVLAILALLWLLIPVQLFLYYRRKR